MEMTSNGLQDMLGMPTQNALVRGAMDDVPASVEGTNEPLQVSEGEFIFSVPAIIGLGEGDYQTGLALLEQIHSEMSMIGQELAGQMGLGSLYEG